MSSLTSISIEGDTLSSGSGQSVRRTATVKRRSKGFTFRLPLMLGVLMYLLMIAYAFLVLPELSSPTGKQTSSRLLIITGTGNTCNLTLMEGFNLVSFPCLGDPENRETFFDNLNTSYTSIRTFRSGDTQDPWKGYNPSLPNWTSQDIDTITRAEGYWIEIDSSGYFYYNNTLDTPTRFNFVAGWNLMGYPSIQNRTPNVTFATLAPYYDYVILYNRSEDDLKEHTWNASLPSDQDLVIMVPQYGYWIYMLQSAELFLD